ncbi:MAG: START domain-containing protein [Gammaproteobacteria bacterium]|nr:START domain-containing protein [Gammaproteobacteria bacterium]
MKRFTLLAGIALSVLSPWSLAEVSPWELEAHDEDLDIKVFTREVEGSELKEFKGVTHIKADVNAFVALLKDDPEATSWMHNVIVFDVKERISDVENVIYTVNEAPWPVTNRDTYIRSFFSADENGVVTSSIKAEPDYAEVNEDYVRMPSIEGAWTFAPQAEGMVEVTYQVHANPGGSLPDWLVNSIVVETPMETLTNLHTKVLDEKYQNQTYAFIENAKAKPASTELVAE